MYLLFTFVQVNVSLYRNHSVDLQLICIANQFIGPCMSERIFGLKSVNFQKCVDVQLKLDLFN